MNRKWMVLIAGLVSITGCNSQETAQRAGQDEVRDAAGPAELATRPQDSLPSTAILSNAEPAERQGNAVAADDQHAEAPRLDANQVLNDAIAKADASHKALFVHFTADW